MVWQTLLSLDRSHTTILPFAVMARRWLSDTGGENESAEDDEDAADDADDAAELCLGGSGASSVLR